MHTSTTRASLLLLFLHFSLALGKNKVIQKNQEILQDPENRRNGRKKKKVDGRVFASYGLSADNKSPNRVIDYSADAVSAASSAAKKPAAKANILNPLKVGAKKTPPGQMEASAPGTQAKVDLRPYMSEVEDQADSNSCAANAVAGAYEYLAMRAAMREGETDGGDISRLFIYYVGRKRDQINWGENPQIRPKDEGMSLGGAIEAVQLKGAALQASWPFNLTNVNVRPTEDAFEEATRFKVGDAMNVPLNLNRMRQCLSDGYPIIFGLKLTKAFFSPPRDGFMPTPDPSDPESAEHGLHAMLIVGYNDRQRIFIVRNSWGPNWGVGGYIYLSYDYVVNEAFNFLGMYAIQSLTDDDLTPDDDDGDDAEHDDLEPHDGNIDIEIEDEEDDEEEDEEEDFDAEDMFDTIAEARRAFVEFSGEDLRMSKAELRSALLRMGVPMLTDEEIEWAFRRYDTDHSGWISFEQFRNMHALFDGSLMWRRNKLKRIMRMVDYLLQNASELLRSKEIGYDGKEPKCVDEDFDVNCIFSDMDEAHRAFEGFSGGDRRLTRTDLNITLLQMGISIVSNEEIEMAFQRYDHDSSDDISFDEFVNMRSLLDGSLLEQQRKFKELETIVSDWKWLQNATEIFRREEKDTKEERQTENIDSNIFFGTIEDAYQAFQNFAGDDLHLSNVELLDALLSMGIYAVTEEEIKMAFRRYDRDRSGYISFNEFTEMRSLLDGSLLQRRRKLKSLVLRVKRLPWVKKTANFFRKYRNYTTGDIFGTHHEANLAFEKFADKDLGLTEGGLHDALVYMGVSTISNEELKAVFQQNNDSSGHVTRDKFLDILKTYRSSMLWCRRKSRSVKSVANKYKQKTLQSYKEWGDAAAQISRQKVKSLISVLNDCARHGVLQKVGIQLAYKIDLQTNSDDLIILYDESLRWCRQKVKNMIPELTDMAQKGVIRNTGIALNYDD